MAIVSILWAVFFWLISTAVWAQDRSIPVPILQQIKKFSDEIKLHSDHLVNTHRYYEAQIEGLIDQHQRLDERLRGELDGQEKERLTLEKQKTVAQILQNFDGYYRGKLEVHQEIRKRLDQILNLVQEFGDHEASIAQSRDKTAQAMDDLNGILSEFDGRLVNFGLLYEYVDDPEVAAILRRDAGELLHHKERLAQTIRNFEQLAHFQQQQLANGGLVAWVARIRQRFIDIEPILHGKAVLTREIGMTKFGILKTWRGSKEVEQIWANLQRSEKEGTMDLPWNIISGSDLTFPSVELLYEEAAPVRGGEGLSDEQMRGLVNFRRQNP